MFNKNKKEESLNLLTYLLINQYAFEDKSLDFNYENIEEIIYMNNKTKNSFLSIEECEKLIKEDKFNFNKKLSNSKYIYLKISFKDKRNSIFLNLKYVSSKFLKTVPENQKLKRYIGNYFIQSYSV